MARSGQLQVMPTVRDSRNVRFELVDQLGFQIVLRSVPQRTDAHGVFPSSSAPAAAAAAVTSGEKKSGKINRKGIDKKSRKSLGGDKKKVPSDGAAPTKRAPTLKNASGAVKLDDRQLRLARSSVMDVSLSGPVVSYARDLCFAVRNDPRIVQMTSARTSQSLLLAARGVAFLLEGQFTTPENVRSVCASVLTHRILVTSVDDEGTSEVDVVAHIIDGVDPPV